MGVQRNGVELSLGFRIHFLNGQQKVPMSGSIGTQLKYNVLLEVEQDNAGGGLVHQGHVGVDRWAPRRSATKVSMIN